jgi:bis(5'-nucleosyl)-tetraphosphatase (symmetrical)
MATYVIGDVQGCFNALLKLLDTIGFARTRDQVWLAGDLVNRGSQSLEVLRFVKSLGGRARIVLGNHDLHLLAVGYGCGKLKPKDTFHDVLRAPDLHVLLAWLRRQPLLYHDSTRNVTLVHAGLPPQWSIAQAQAHAAEVEATLQGPHYKAFLAQIAYNPVTSWDAALQGWERLKYITNALTQLRYCDAAGRLALRAKGPPGTQPEPYLPWFAFAERVPARHIILFGHWATLGPCHVPGVYALDTGCVWGGTLTALCLETKEYIRVACDSACG